MKNNSGKESLISFKNTTRRTRFRSLTIAINGKLKEFVLRHNVMNTLLYLHQKPVAWKFYLTRTQHIMILYCLWYVFFFLFLVVCSSPMLRKQVSIKASYLYLTVSGYLLLAVLLLGEFWFFQFTYALFVKCGTNLDALTSMY